MLKGIRGKSRRWLIYILLINKYNRRHLKQRKKCEKKNVRVEISMTLIYQLISTANPAKMQNVEKMD